MWAKEGEAKSITAHILGIIIILLILTSQHSIIFPILNLLRQENKLSPTSLGQGNLSS